MSIRTDDSGSPGALVGDLTGPGTLVSNGLNAYTTTGIDLAADTTYFLLLNSSSAANNRTENTASNNEDSGGQSGWSIADGSVYRSRTSTGGWTDFSESKQIAVKGYAKAAALVSNTGQTSGTSALNVGTSGSNKWSMALGFTTGDNAGGYTLSSVEVGLRAGFGENDEARVSIYGADASGKPESSLHVLMNPASITNGELNTFTVPGSATLTKETKYFVVVESAAASQIFNLSVTASDAEDTGKATGWAIDDRRHERTSDSGNWEQSTFTNKPRIAVKGTVNGGTALSTDATLSALALSGVTLDQTFVSTTETYTATVANSVTETTVTATPTDSGATVEFKDDDNNALTSAVSLAVGANVIKAVVTAEDTTTMKTYMVTVTREAAAGTCLAPTFTGRAEVWRGTITVGNDAFSRGYEANRFGDLSDPDDFDYGGTNYTIAGIRESFDTGSVNRLELDLDAFLPDSDQDKLRLHLCGDTFDLTAATQEGTSTYRWTGAVLDWSGATTIEAALSGTLSTDATLSALALSGVTLSPAFVSTTETYTATVGNSVTETTVTATPTDSGATVEFKDDDNNALTSAVSLAVGANVIKAVVTAEDTTTTKTYTVTVTREAAAGTCLAPTFTGRAEVWRGTITVGNDAFSRGYEANRFGDLSDPDDFDYGGTNYTIAGIRESFDTGSVNRLELDLGAFLPDSDQDKLRLHLCGDTFDLTTATQEGTSTYRWTGAVLDWSGATTIEAALSGTLSTDATLSALALSGVTLSPAFVSTTETYTATVGNSVTETTVTATPTHSGATVEFKDDDGNALTNPVSLAVGDNVIKVEVTAEDTTTTKTYMVTVTSDDTTAPRLDSAAVPSAGITVELNFDEALVIPTTLPRAFTLTADGVELDIQQLSGGGDLLTLNLASGTKIYASQTVRLSYDNTASNGTLEDAAGNEVASFTDFAVTNNSTITATTIVDGGVQVTSTAATGDTYGQHETIVITVTFDNAVTVDISGGRPRIGFRLDGALNKWAGYSRGSGSTELVFAYGVKAGDMDADGIWLPANFLQLQGGTIRAAADPTVDASLTYAEPGLQTEHKVDGSSTIADATLSALTLSTGTLAPTFRSNRETYTATVAIAVTQTRVTASPTQPGATVAFTDGNNTAIPNLLPLDVGPNVIKVVVTAPNGMTTKTYMVTVTRQATTTPEIVTDGVEVTSTPRATADTYGRGETIAITVIFDKAVTVDTSGGTPRIRFVFIKDGNPVAGWAGYRRGSAGGTALVFTYTVQAGDRDDEGIWLPANYLELQGGTIRAAADPTVDASLTYAQPGTQSGHMVNGSLTTADATLRALELSGVTLSPTFVSSRETYTATVVNGVTQTTVTATPTLLGSGATVAFTDGAGNALTGPVTLAVGATVIKAVVTAPNGTTTKTYMVTVTRAPVIVTDGVKVTSTPMATADTYGRGETIAITVAFDNAVTVDTSGGRPRIAFYLDGGLRWAVYRNGSGGTDLKFTYTVLADDRAVNGILLAAGEVHLFRSRIRAAADNSVDASLTYAEPGLQIGHKVDGSLPTTNDDDDDDGTDGDDGTTPPAIVTDGVQVTSTPRATGDTYGLGETIAITVTFDNAVTVDTSGGTRRPGIAFHLDGDLNQNRWAVYNSSGSGGTALLFTYTVLADDMDADGIWLPANKLELFSATIRDATDTSVDATLIYAEPGLQIGHKVDGSLTTTGTAPPAIVTDGVQVTSTPATDDTYGLGETIAITVTFDNAVTVDTSGGTRRPGIAFHLDGDLNQNRWAVYNSSGSGGTALLFTYTVLADDMDADGIWLPANKLEPFSGTIRAAADNSVDASLTYAEPGTQSGHKVKGSPTTTDDDDGTTSPPTGTGGGGGGAGGTPGGTVPDAPTNLQVDGGDEQVTLSWDAPEDDGGSPITGYEYRIDGEGEWISTDSTDTTHTVTGLTNGTAYIFEVRTVTAAGSSPSSDRSETTPGMGGLDFAHFANGEGITSELVFVNVATHPIRSALYFYDQEGQPIDPESMVDLTEDLEITEDGSLSIRTAMEPLGELTISTHGRGEVMSGSVKAVSNGPMGGVLRFGLLDIGVAGVGASLPLTDALFPVRRGGELSTAAAIRNLSESGLVVSCRLMQEGMMLEEMEIPLAANGQEALYIEEMFTFIGAGMSDFVGSVRCTAPPGEGMFTGVAVELDADNRIFTTLPVVPVDASGGGGRETVLDFAHFANGAGVTSELVLVNRSTQPSRTAPTPFHSDILPNLPVLYFYDQGGDLIDPASVVDITDDLVVTEDGSLSVQTEMEPLGVLTISTHGRGNLVSGSVKVTSDRPIGGVLRFDLPGIGVAGVGASQPVRDAIFPARRQAGGISTAAAIHNLGEEAMVVSCRLMKEGAVLEEAEIPLVANGQEALYIEEMFTGTDTSDFVGSVRCMAPSVGEGMFTGVAVELDASNQIFTTLPVVPIQR